MRGYITVLSTDHYVGGVLVLGESLKRVQAGYPLYCICSDNLSDETITTLEKNDIKVIKKPQIDISVFSGNQMSGWDYTFFKFHIFDMMEFEKLVFLDADMMVIRNIDDLFDRKFALCRDDYQFTGVKNVAKGCNSGLIVFKPSHALYQKLIEMLPQAYAMGVRGDQEVLNLFLDDSVEWLSAKYNMASTMVEKTVLREKYFDFHVRDICVIHFVWEGNKPFLEYLLKPRDFVRKIMKLHFCELSYLVQYYRLVKSLKEQQIFWKYVVK